MWKGLVGVLDRIAMRREKRHCPSDLIGEPLPARLASYPQFQVFKSVIGAHSILVVNRLPLVQGAAKVLLHHKAMLKYRVPVSCQASADVPVVVRRPLSLGIASATVGAKLPVAVYLPFRLPLLHRKFFCAKGAVDQCAPLGALRGALAFVRAKAAILGGGVKLLVALLASERVHNRSIAHMGCGA